MSITKHFFLVEVHLTLAERIYAELSACSKLPEVCRACDCMYRVRADEQCLEIQYQAGSGVNRESTVPLNQHHYEGAQPATVIFAGRTLLTGPLTPNALRRRLKPTPTNRTRAQ